MLAIVVARIALAPPLLAIATWFIAWRSARPDQAPRWLTVKLTVLPTALALASIATAFDYPPLALGMLALANVVAYAVAIQLWLERRPKPLAPEDAAHEARRLADAAGALADDAERRAKGPRA